MTLWLWAVAAGLALLGTRLTFAALAGACVLSFLEGGPQGAASGAAAFVAACALAFGRHPRRIAAPAVGAAAVLVAAAAPNVAAVLPAWTVAAGAAVVAATWRSPATARRWGLAVLASDALLVAAVTWLAVTGGYAAWPGDVPPRILAVVAAAGLVRAPLTAGPFDRLAEPGVVLVRLQSAVLIHMALRAGAPSWLANAVLLAGSCLVAIGPLGSRESIRDAVQDTGLVAVALAAAALGWVAPGWVAAAMVCGALVHLVRLAEPRGDPAARTARRIVATAMFGSPLLGVSFAMASGAVPRGTVAAAAVLLLVVGLAGRFFATAADRRDGAPKPVAAAIALLAVAAGAVTAVASGHGPAGPASVGAGALLVAGAVCGARFATLVTPPRPRRLAPGALSATLGGVARPLALADRPWALPGGVAAYLLVSLVLIALGFARGFL